MDWLELKINTTPENVELMSGMLTVWGYDSFSVEDGTEFESFLRDNKDYWDYVDEDLSSAMANKSDIVLYLENTPDVAERIAGLRSQLAALPSLFPTLFDAIPEIHISNVQEEDWANNWKQYYHPIAIGKKLLVVPKWMNPENPEHRLPVILDPGMIFGTGNHASTRMCMMELERLVKGGEQVVDLGSGSGILSITALLLGASSATGVDIDPKAEDIARENAAFNNLGPDRFTACTGNVLDDAGFVAKLKGTEGYDIVLANIVADVIIPLAPVVPGLLKPTGTFVCSGVLNTRLEEVRKALTDAGLTVTDVREEEDWCRLTAVK